MGAKPRLDRDGLRREFYAAVDRGGLSPRAAVRAYRKMLGKTQREFAAFVRVAPRILIAFEQGKGNPTLKTMQRLLRGSGLELKVGRRSPDSKGANRPNIPSN